MSPFYTLWMILFPKAWNLFFDLIAPSSKLTNYVGKDTCFSVISFTYLTGAPDELKQNLLFLNVRIPFRFCRN